MSASVSRFEMVSVEVSPMCTAAPLFTVSLPPVLSSAVNNAGNCTRKRVSNKTDMEFLFVKTAILVYFYFANIIINTY
jgi:hypothetical protein